MAPRSTQGMVQPRNNTKRATTAEAPRMQLALAAARKGPQVAVVLKHVVVPVKSKKPLATIKHPKVSVMVIEAIDRLRERKGSSVQAIKKYISDVYKADVDKLGRYIKDFLRSGTEKGELIQVTGIGATGSFRLPAKNAAKAKAPAKIKVAAPPKKAAAKKPAAKAKAPTKKQATARPMSSRLRKQ